MVTGLPRGQEVSGLPDPLDQKNNIQAVILHKVHKRTLCQITCIKQF